MGFLYFKTRMLFWGGSDSVCLVPTLVPYASFVILAISPVHLKYIYIERLITSVLVYGFINVQLNLVELIAINCVSYSLLTF